MSRTPLIFAVCIIAAVLLTITTMSFITPQDGSQDDIIPFLETSDAIAGTLHQPEGVAVNGSDNIFVADTRNSIIQVFNADGSFNFTFSTADNNPNDSSLFWPKALSINSTNFIHVVSTYGNVVKVFDKGGVYLKTIGSPGDQSGQLHRPSGITTNATHIFVADTSNNRINIYNHSGALDDTIP